MSLSPILHAVAAALLVVPAYCKDGDPPAGRLDALSSSGASLGSCPLKHTAVEAELSGTVARVSVTQQFHNPFREKIEAVYVFPLHQDSAVDHMEMKVGDRVVKGVIKEREEAGKIYAEAKHKGKVASLLDQERSNIFTQAVANIEPGQQVTITIRYSQTLAWKDGRFEFDFPTVVGPRYIPGSPGIPEKADREKDAMPSMFPPIPPQRGPQGEAPVVNPDPVPPTDQVPDADRITPPVALEGFRAGHDVSVTVKIDAGLPISDIRSASHEITVEHPGGDAARAIVRLKDGVSLPDRDFTLGYRTAGAEITDAVLTHTGEQGNFFTLVLQPPARVAPAQVVPRELIFVLDTSGSMGGFPMETSKSLMRRAINSLRPADRFNLITFSGSTAMMAPEPLDNTEANRHRALRFIDTLHGGGGTEMMKAIDAALGGGLDPDKVRIVCFLTDGYVGNDMEIIAAVQKHARSTRVFGFGIGGSVNRFLLDSMARAGRGDVQYVLTHEEGGKAAARFYERIDAPVLTDVALDFGALAVVDVYPKNPEDLFASQPVVVKGRYTKAGTGVVRLTGRNASGAWHHDLTVTLPERNPDNSVLAPQWARAKVDHLMMRDMEGMQSGNPEPGLKREIIELGTTYSLLTQFTSFVAVEEQHTTEGGQPRTVLVPLEMPSGVSQAGVFGTGAGFGSGSGGGMGGGGSGKMFGLVPSTMSHRCSKSDRLARLKENGGLPQCEDAVIKALDWLKQRQNADGSWCDSGRAAATGLALSVYQGNCESPVSMKYGESILKATVFLINQSSTNKGILSDDPKGPMRHHEHAIATTALAEACMINKQIRITVPGLDEAVLRAGQIIIDNALPSGGWSLTKDGKADTTLTCMNLQSLRACSLTHIKFRGMTPCVSKALAAINPSHDAPGAFAFASQLWSKGSVPEVLAACETLSRRPPFRWSPPQSDPWTLYFDTHALFRHGGKPWADFNASLHPELLKAQTADGSFTDPGDAAAPTPLAGLLAGRSATHSRTCLTILTLEVYYGFTLSTGKTPNP